jgi:uncharacterized protein YfbU (UPF0304 family)
MKKTQIAIRVDTALLKRARSLSDKNGNPYAPSLIQIIERGLELALRELERKK